MTESNEAKPKKTTIYRSTDIPGIRSVWDWSEKKNEYVKRKTGNRYIATIEKNARTKSESFGSLEDASKWREKIKYDLERMPYVKPMTFQNLTECFLKKKSEKLQITTLESYQSLLKHFTKLNNFLVEDILSQTIDSWLVELKSEDYKRKMKIKSIRISYNHEVTLLRNIFSYYKEYFNEKYENPVRARHDTDSVVNPIELEKRKSAQKNKYISGDDIELLLATFKAQALTKPEKGIYSTLALLQMRTGLRIGEACAFKWEDINWIDGVVEISKTIQWMRAKNRQSVVSNRTKTGQSRKVLLLPDVLETLKKLQINQGRIAGLIFSDDGINVMNYRRIQYHYECAFKEANVSFRSTHIMRHSFATHFLELTRDKNALQGLLGHSSVKMTEKYAKTTDFINVSGMIAYGHGLKKV